jgi:putative ABC transport system permease protein
MILRIRTAGLSQTLQDIQKIWRKVNPDKPFVYSFADDDLESQYRSEQRWMGIVRSSSIFTLFIAGMGMFGLTSLAVNRRFNEIGIRKVFGARIPQIVRMIFSEFLLLLFLANLSAWPAAYIVVGRILKSYAYRVPLGPGFFLLAGAFSFTVAFAAVGFLAFRAAAADPVQTIRYE